jgi:hypothetical protein
LGHRCVELCRESIDRPPQEVEDVMPRQHHHCLSANRVDGQIEATEIELHVAATQELPLHHQNLKSTASSFFVLSPHPTMAIRKTMPWTKMK